MRDTIHPAVTAVSWLGLGIVCCVGPRDFLNPVLFILAFVAVAGFLAFVTLRQNLPACLLFFPLGFSLAVLHSRAPWQTYRKILPRDVCGMQIRAVVVSAAYSGTRLEWLRCSRTGVMRIRAMRRSPDLPWRKCRGKLLLKFSTRTPMPPYGTGLELDGAFTLAQDAWTGGCFDYRGYLENKGIRHVFVADEKLRQTPVKGWRILPAVLYRLRDRCGECLARNVAGDANRRMLLAMTFGFREGLSGNFRQRFLKSGAIHIFAISGLHVGIVASILLALMRFSGIPFTFRHAVLPILLGLYVFLTGSSASAVRAWTMICIWAATKSRFLPAVHLNTVAVAAFVLLVANPFSLLQAGFQFSFIIVTVLVLGWPILSQTVAVLAERSFWLPPARRLPNVLRRRWRNFLQLVGASLLAWFGSAGLILLVNNLIIPVSVVVNIVISLLAWLTLLVACIKLGLAFLPFEAVDVFLGWIASRLLGGINFAVDVGSRSPLSLSAARPDPWIISVYYLFLFLVFQQKLPIRWRRAAAFAGVVILTGCALWSKTRDPGVTLFWSGKSSVPALVVSGGSSPPVLVNTAGFDAARAEIEWMASQGFERLEALILPEGSRPVAGGAAMVLQTLPARTLVMRLSHRSSALESALTQQSRHGRRMRELKTVNRGRAEQLVWNTPCLGFSFEREGPNRHIYVRRECPDHRLDVTVTVPETGPVEINLQKDHQSPQKIRIFPSLCLRVTQLQLEHPTANSVRPPGTDACEDLRR